MTKNPVTAPSDATVGEVLSTLYELDARHLPIIDNGQLAGIVSDRDLRPYAVPKPGVLEIDAEFADGLQKSISDVMSGNVVSVEAESEVSEVIDLMLEEKVGAVPVIDRESLELIGIISYVDILRAVHKSV
jgi:acetoin utilization protein AcuB